MSEDLNSRFDNLKSRFNQMQDDVRMTGTQAEIDAMHDKIRAMPDEIQAIRQRGYAFRSYLEQKAETLNRHWEDIRGQVHRAIDQESDELRQDFRDAEESINRAGRFLQENAVEKLEETFDTLKSKIEAAENRVRQIYATLKSDVDQAAGQLSEIRWILDQKEEASFEFLSSEAVFLAAKAEWVATGKGNKDPDGVLYLTDQRLVFEQKETTGKTLGMFGGKKEQELEWEIPLHQIGSVEAEKKGMLGGKDMLHFMLQSGAPYDTLVIEVKGGEDCRFWQQQITRMIAGETNDERAIQPDPELVERMREAPTACHVCGATLPKLVANQSQIECAYCGTVIRI